MKLFSQTHGLSNSFQKFQSWPMLTSVVRGDQSNDVLLFASLSQLWNRQLLSAVNPNQVHLLCRLIFLKSQNQLDDVWTRNAVQAVLEYPVPPLHEVVRAWWSNRALLFILHESIRKLRDFSANLDRRDFCAKEFCNCVIFTWRRSNGLAG
jgi:hypothetical protein